MKNSKFFPLVIISLFFIIFPLISNAQFNPIGPGCTPDNAFSSSDTQLCQYNYGGPNQPREVHLKWNVVYTGGNNQICSLGCTDNGGQLCRGFSSKDNNGFAVTSFNNAGRFRPKDDVKINDPTLMAGNNYRVSCCQAKKDPTNLLDMLEFCQPGTGSQSQNMIIVNSALSGATVKAISYSSSSTNIIIASSVTLPTASGSVEKKCAYTYVYDKYWPDQTSGRITTRGQTEGGTFRYLSASDVIYAIDNEGKPLVYQIPPDHSTWVPPSRRTHSWFLQAWNDSLACQPYVDDEGQPTCQDCNVDIVPYSGSNKSASNNKSSWLANAWSAWQGIFK